MSSLNNNQDNNFTVPTVFEKQVVKMDVTGLTASDLEQLKRCDGFYVLFDSSCKEGLGR
jgi:hypothetical protein